jgi:hypothetical protein
MTTVATVAAVATVTTVATVTAVATMAAVPSYDSTLARYLEANDQSQERDNTQEQNSIHGRTSPKSSHE